MILHERPADQSRWTLSSLQQCSRPILGQISTSGLHGLLKKLGITYQRGRPYIHSPDEQYQAKLAYLKQIIAKANTEGIEVLFEDEFTVINQASSGADFAPKGQQPKERWAHTEKKIRLAGAMNAISGQTTIYQCPKMTIQHFINFLKLVVEDYPQADKIYMPVDGWPIHFHPSVQAALVTQEQPFEPKLPPSWKKVKPDPEYAELNLPIQMVSLPTYASWLNPIEKLWKLLKKEVLHLFPNPNNFNELQLRINRFFEEFEQDSLRLLKFCGLCKFQGCFYEPLLEANAPFLNTGVIF